MFHYLDILQFIRLPTEGQLSCFQILEIKNKAATNIHVQILDINFKFLWVNIKEHKC